MEGGPDVTAAARIARVEERIAAVEARTVTPAAGFAARLSALAAPIAGPEGRLNDAADAVGSASAGTAPQVDTAGAGLATITLSQLLGRPVRAVASVVHTDATDGPRGVALQRPLAAGVGSGYGLRDHPVTGAHRMHHGVDIAAPTGTPVHAAASGRVVFAGDRGGYGNLVEIDHGGGVTTRYAHQAGIEVRVGDVVAAGQVVGTVGSTGRSTGPHLHFEVRVDGASVDPEAWLP